jgi:hypothetical protein
MHWFSRLNAIGQIRPQAGAGQGATRIHVERRF